MIPEGMTIYARMCASTLARAHARSPDRHRLLHRQERRVRRGHRGLLAAYADQNERDYERFRGAVKKGNIKAETGL